MAAYTTLVHSSVTYKLILNEGDIKAVQGDTGHASTSMVMDTYAHIQDESRQINTMNFDNRFYIGETKDAKSIYSDGEIVRILLSNPELRKRALALIRN